MRTFFLGAVAALALAAAVPSHGAAVDESRELPTGLVNPNELPPGLQGREQLPPGLDRRMGDEQQDGQQAVVPEDEDAVPGESPDRDLRHAPDTDLDSDNDASAGLRADGIGADVDTNDAR